jgi:hypothetical protein
VDMSSAQNGRAPGMEGVPGAPRRAPGEGVAQDPACVEGSDINPSVDEQLFD